MLYGGGHYDPQILESRENPENPAYICFFLLLKFDGSPPPIKYLFSPLYLYPSKLSMKIPHFNLKKPTWIRSISKCK